MNCRHWFFQRVWIFNLVFKFFFTKSSNASLLRNIPSTHIVLTLCCIQQTENQMNISVICRYLELSFRTPWNEIHLWQQTTGLYIPSNPPKIWIEEDICFVFDLDLNLNSCDWPNHPFSLSVSDMDHNGSPHEEPQRKWIMGWPSVSSLQRRGDDMMRWPAPSQSKNNFTE